MTKQYNYFKNYFSKIKLSLDSIELNQLYEVSELLRGVKSLGRKIIFIGNGGSASIASHLTVDFINAVGIRAINFNEASIITCFSNDYGYENWVGKALDCYADSGDIAILISSSGQSQNMIVGAKKAKSMDVNVVTLSGFSYNNQLRQLGDINLWVNSEEYNIVEMTHNIWLLAIVDFIIERNK